MRGRGISAVGSARLPSALAACRICVAMLSTLHTAVSKCLPPTCISNGSSSSFSPEASRPGGTIGEGTRIGW
eukprot:5110149-Pleurochrysis_carterae.AAC.1